VPGVFLAGVKYFVSRPRHHQRVTGVGEPFSRRTVAGLPRRIERSSSIATVYVYSALFSGGAQGPGSPGPGPASLSRNGAQATRCCFSSRRLCFPGRHLAQLDCSDNPCQLQVFPMSRSG